MAYVGSANTVVSGGNGAGTYLYVLKEALLSAGWDLVLNSTGAAGFTPVSADQLTTPALFGAANAWARLREPVPVSPPPGYIGAREYILQNGAANGTTAIIKYSRATGFNTGGSGAVAPTTGVGGDGQVLIGAYGSTDTSVTPATIANASGYVAAIASDTPSPGTHGAYSWYLIGWTAGGANVITVLTESVTPGSTSSLDQDPTWRYGTGQGLPSPSSQIVPVPYYLGGAWYSNVALGTQYWQAYGIDPVYCRFCQTSNLVSRTPVDNSWAYATAGFTSVSPYDGREPMYPLMIGQAGVSAYGQPARIPKGFTTGVASFAATHNLLDTFNLNTVDPKIAVSLTVNGMVSIAMPWLTNIVPAV